MFRTRTFFLINSYYLFIIAVAFLLPIHLSAQQVNKDSVVVLDEVVVTTNIKNNHRIDTLLQHVRKNFSRNYSNIPVFYVANVHHAAIIADTVCAFNGAMVLVVSKQIGGLNKPYAYINNADTASVVCKKTGNKWLEDRYAILAPFGMRETLAILNFENNNYYSFLNKTKLYNYLIREDNTRYYITFFSKNTKGEWEGAMEVNKKDFAIVWLSFKNTKPIKRLLLIDVQLTRINKTICVANDFYTSISFEKEKDTYYLKSSLTRSDCNIIPPDGKPIPFCTNTMVTALHVYNQLHFEAQKNKIININTFAIHQLPTLYNEIK